MSAHIDLPKQVIKKIRAGNKSFFDEPSEKKPQNICFGDYVSEAPFR